MPVTRIKSDLLGVDFKVRSDGELNSRDYFDILKEVGPDGQQIVSPQDLLHVYKSAPYDERRQKLAINALDNGFFESEGSFTEAMTHMGASVGRGIGKSVTTNLYGTSRLLKGQLDYGEPEDDTPQNPLVEQGILKAAQQLRGLSYAAKRSDRSFDQDLDSAMLFAGIDKKNDALKRRVVAEARLQDASQSEATLAQAGLEAAAMPATIGAKGAEWTKQLGTFDDNKEKLATIDYLAEQFDIADKIERGAELGLAQGGALATLVNVYTGLDPNFNVNEKALADVQAGVVQPDRDVAMAASFAMMPDMWASMGAGAGVNLGLRSISRGAIMKAAQAASEESALKANISFWKGASGYAPGSVEKIIASTEQKLAKVAGSQERLNKLVAKSEGMAQSLSAKLASAGQGESPQAARLLRAIEKAPDPKAPLINRAVGKALQGTGYTVEHVGRAGELLRRLPEETLTTLFMRSGGMDEASARAIARTAQIAVAAGTLTGGFQDLDPNFAQLATALLLTPGGPSMITRLGHDVGILGKQLQLAQAGSPLFQRIAQMEPPEASFVEASLDRTAAMTLPETVGGLAQKIFSPTRQFGPSVALKAPSTFLSRTGFGNTLTGAVNTAKTAAGAAAIPGAFGYALGGEEGAGGAIGASWPFIAAGLGAGQLMRFGSMADVHAKMLGDRAVYKETLSPVDLVEFQSYTKPVQQALATAAVQNPDVIVNFKKGKKSSYYAQENGESVITLYDGSTAAEQLSAVLGHEIAHHIDTFGFMPYVIEELLGSVEKKKPGVYTEYKDGKPIIIKDEAGNNVYATNDEFAIRRKQYLDRLEPGSEAYNRYANNDALIAREVFASHGAAWYFGGEFVKKNWQGAGSKMMGAILDPIFGSNGMRKFLHRIGIPTNEGTKLVADPTYGGKGLMPGLKEVPALVRMIEKYNADVRGYGAEARRQGRGRGNLVGPAFKDEVASVSLTAKDLENPAIVERLKAGGHVKIADDGSIEVDASGRPVFLPTREVNKNNKQLSNDILDIIRKKEDAGETFGADHVAMVETADGKPRATGRFLDPSIIAELRKQNRYNQHQLDALARINATLRNDTGDVWNLFYYSALKYNKAGRKVYGQIKGGDRPSLPFGIEITKDGNVIISTISLDAIQKNLEWFAKSKGYRQKMFDEFGGNNANEIVRNALSLLPQYLENHRKGKTDPAFENGKPASGISEGQRDLLNAAIGKINAEQVKRNPILEGLGDRRSNRQQSYRSRRLDRIGNAVRGEDGYYASTSRIERNLQPMRMPRRKPNHDTIPLPFDELPGDIPGEGFGRMINVDKTKAEMAEAKRLADEAQSGFSSSGNVRSKDAYGRDKLFMPARNAAKKSINRRQVLKLLSLAPFAPSIALKTTKMVGKRFPVKDREHLLALKEELEGFRQNLQDDNLMESPNYEDILSIQEKVDKLLVSKVVPKEIEFSSNFEAEFAHDAWDNVATFNENKNWPEPPEIFQKSSRPSEANFDNILASLADILQDSPLNDSIKAKIDKLTLDEILRLLEGKQVELKAESGIIPIQIESGKIEVISNRGTFDAGDPNMLYMPASAGKDKKPAMLGAIIGEEIVLQKANLSEQNHSDFPAKFRRADEDGTFRYNPDTKTVYWWNPRQTSKNKWAVEQYLEDKGLKVEDQTAMFLPEGSKRDPFNEAHGMLYMPAAKPESVSPKSIRKAVAKGTQGDIADRGITIDKALADRLFMPAAAAYFDPGFSPESYVGKTAFPMMADRMKTGMHVTRAGKEYELRGGPDHPDMPINQGKVAWASMDGGQASQLQNAINRTDGIGLVTLMNDDALASNRTFARIMMDELRYDFENNAKARKTLPKRIKDAAKEVRVWAKKQKPQKKAYMDFEVKSLDELEAAYPALSFDVRKMLFKKIAAIDYKRKVGGFFWLDLVRDLAAYKNEDGYRTGDIVKVIQFDQGNSIVNLADLGITPDPTYDVSFGGKSISNVKGRVSAFQVLRKGFDILAEEAGKPGRTMTPEGKIGPNAFRTVQMRGLTEPKFSRELTPGSLEARNYPPLKFSEKTGPERASLEVRESENLFMPAAKLYGPVENIGGIRLKKDSRYGPTNTAVVGRGKAAEEHYMHGYSLPDEVAAEAIKKHNDYGAGRLLHYVADGDFETKAPKSLKAWTDIQKRLTAEIQRERNVAKNAAQESKEFLAKYGKSADNLLSWRSDATRQYGTDYDGLVYRGEKSDKAANIKKDGIKTKWEEPSNISKSIYPLLKIELENGTSFYEQVRISDHDQVSANAPRYYEYDYRAKDFMEAFPKIEEDMQGLAWDMWAEQKEYLEGLK